MKVTGVTPTDAASDPLHPDHDRWVKERTLAIEVAHAERTGGTLRDAERENARMLIRMEALARSEKIKTQPDPHKSRRQRFLERAVEVREALPKRDPGVTWLKSSPCGRCGVCRPCMRERRILALGRMATQQKEPQALALMWDMFAYLARSATKAGEFRDKSESDINRMVTAKAEAICDQSVRWLGAWIR